MPRFRRRPAGVALKECGDNHLGPIQTVLTTQGGGDRQSALAHPEFLEIRREPRQGRVPAGHGICGPKLTPGRIRHFPHFFGRFACIAGLDRLARGVADSESAV